MILQGYIILPLLKRIFPQILKEIIFIIGLEVRHIEGARKTILSGKIYLVSLAIDLLQYFEWTVSSRHELGLGELLSLTIVMIFHGYIMFAAQKNVLHKWHFEVQVKLHKVPFTMQFK